MKTNVQREIERLRENEPPQGTPEYRAWLTRLRWLKSHKGVRRPTPQGQTR